MSIVPPNSLALAAGAPKNPDEISSGRWSPGIPKTKIFFDKFTKCSILARTLRNNGPPAMSPWESLALVHRQALLDDGQVTPAAPGPQSLIDRARALIARYLAEPPAAIDTLIFWCLHTWAHARFDVSPRLILHGRDPRADHGRALRLLRWLTPNPRLVSRATASTVLDLLAHERPTLLFDDAANAILLRRDMRVLIAAGARQDGMFLGQRGRRKGSAFRRCAAPLALATSLPPPETVLAHAIVLPMAPALVGGGAERPAIGEPPDDARALRAEIQAFAQHLAQRDLALTAPLPPFLSASARETWAPLFALAHAIGGEAEASIRAAASQFASPEHLEPPTSALALLRAIRRLAGIDGQPVSSKLLVEQLTGDPDGPWVACDWGAKLTPRGIAQRLARFDLKPQIIHPANAPSFRGYKADALLNAFARYLDDPVAIAVLRCEGRAE